MNKLNSNQQFCINKIIEMRMFLRKRGIKLPKIYQLGDNFTLGSPDNWIQVSRKNGGYEQRLDGIIEAVKLGYIELTKEDKQEFLNRFDTNTQFLNMLEGIK